MGRGVAKIDFRRTWSRVKDAPRGKYIDVTAITPTPLGEGKTTTTMGLVQGLGAIGKKLVGAIRQPSGGPTFNIKGSAAGGGLAQCIPLAAVLPRPDRRHRLHHQRPQPGHGGADRPHAARDTTTTTRAWPRSGSRRLDIDPDRVQMKWAMDFCAQALRNITIGKGGKMDGFEMESGFQITVSSEIMAILAVAHDLADLRERIGPHRRGLRPSRARRSPPPTWRWTAP